MPHKQKMSAEEKIEIVQRCLSEEASLSQVAKGSRIGRTTLREWISRYRAEGSTAFLPKERNRVYEPEYKKQAVEEYLRGELSIQETCEKYRIRSTVQLRNWIRQYNGHEDFKPRTGGSRMTKGRETTHEERIRIAQECIETGYNYGEIAIKHSISYQQAYTWTKKFKEMGEAGLEDRRGKRTITQEARTPEEEMRNRIAQLEHENYMLRMERDLLKKVEELERRDAYRK